MLAEAKALARLSSPHVVAIYDVGQIDAQVFLSMELIEGQTLRGWLLEKERSWREVLKAFVEAGKGLAAAHSAGLVHRDFKPENVLVGRDGRVRVTDFGLALDDGTRASGAKSRSSSSTLGSRAGTPAYMAPSQLEGGEVDTRNDQFAFCVALYEALYGVRPFKAPTKRTRVVFPPEPELPARVRRALARGLAHDPERRFPSIPALLGALKRSRGKKRKGSAVALPSGVTALRPGRSSSDQGFTSSLH